MIRVKITWYDAYTLDSWQSIDEAKMMLKSKYKVKTVGWLLDESKTHISICHSKTPVQIMGALHIPKECIVKFKKC